MDFLNEVAGQFIGRSELSDNMLIVRFQDERLRFFSDSPVSVGVQYAPNSATCRMFAYVRTDIKANNDKVYELCNRLNSQWCKKHEAFVAAAVPSSELLSVHMEKVRILQHERLVHLIVTVMVVFVELFVVDLVLIHPELGLIPAIVMLGLAVLLGFYFYHYFILENTVQRWYRIADEMREKLKALVMDELE